MTAKHYDPSHGDHLDPIGRSGYSHKKCVDCKGKGMISEIYCEDCGSLCNVVKGGVGRAETKIIDGKEKKINYADAKCIDCGKEGFWPFELKECSKCEGKGYVDQ